MSKSSGTLAVAHVLIDETRWEKEHYAPNGTGQLVRVRDKRVTLGRVSLEVRDRNGQVVALVQCRNRSNVSKSGVQAMADEIVADIDRAAR